MTGNVRRSAPTARVRIRPARPADVPALVGIEAASFRGDRLSRRQFLAHARGASNGAFLVAEAGGAVVGNVLVLFRRGARRARLYSIAVSQAARGLGLGAKLLGAAERAAKSHGASELALEVRTDNRAAIALYESRGYERVGVKAGYYFDGCDALRFIKRWPVAQ